MADGASKEADLLRRIEEQERELAEARATLDAIRSGAVDAVVVQTDEGPRIYTLQGADQVYRVLFDTLNEGALTLSADGLVLAANSRFSSLVRTPLEAVIGQPFVEFVALEDAPRLPEALAGAAGGGTQTEIRLCKASGGTVPALLSANAVLVEGRPDLIAAVATDLTELKRAQHDIEEANRGLQSQHEELEAANEELRIAYEEMETKVAERTAELSAEVAERTRAEEALIEADRRKDEFLAVLSHELRNPLAAVAAAVQVLRERGPADPSLQRAHEAAERQIRHMTLLLDDLLDVARITSGKVRLRKERVLLARVVEDAVELAGPLIEERHHQLSVSLPPQPVDLDGDPTRLTQVLGNLLNNAAKYTDPGGRIWVTAHLEDGCVAVGVKDTGIGIAPELLPHVFDMFSQASQGPERAQGGLGLGLALARELVEMHGGRIEAHSDGPGKGSEFTAHLPVAAPAPEAGAAAPAPAEAAPAHRRILLVEDNVDTAELMAMLLENEGHQVVVAHSGPAALRLAPEYHPDVVLLDIGLPGMDGYQVASRLREQPALAGTTIIALTGYGQDEDRERSREAGIDHHLVKPVNMERLRELLARA